MILQNETDARAYVAKSVDEEAFRRLSQLTELLRAENERQNLVSVASMDVVWLRHIADSVQLFPFIGSARDITWLDLGTGAGFPGLVVAASRSDLNVSLVESRKLRCEWLSYAAQEMGLTNVEVIHRRVEAICDQKFDVISARAFAPLSKLLTLSARFSTSRTRWLLPKGRSARQELIDLPKHQAVLFHVEHSLTDNDAGIIVGLGRPEVKK